MQIRFPSPLDREALVGIIAPGGPFRPEEPSCAIEQLEAALAPAEGGAARFYERAGYRRSGFMESSYRSGDDLIIFTKTLA
jgi:hypothetical protein